MDGKKIGIVIALDGEKQFVQGVSNAKKETASLKAEMKNLSEEYDGNANSMEYLQKKQDILTRQQAAYQNKLKQAQNGLDKANSNYRKQSAKLVELQGELEKASKALDEMKQSGQEGSKGYEKQEKKVKDLSDALVKQTLARQKESGAISDWNKKIFESEAELKKANRAVENNAKYLDEARESTDKCAKSIDEYGDAVEKAQKTESTWMGAAKEGMMEALATKGLNVATEALTAGVDAVKESMMDLSSASATLAAKTGLSKTAMEKYNAVIKEVRGNNFGENYSDVASVMAEIVQVMGEMDPSGIQDITESAITLRDTFDMDVNESIRAVDVMMKTMGVDATTAFDLITAGAQNGLNRSGELVDNITEYASLWGQAGFSAEEMFAILENGLDSGAYNLDKVNDYVKEFGNSLADGRIEKNLSSFSTGTQDLFRKWKDGEASTSDVFYSVINDLSKMTNQQEALTLASEVWSALGEDNAMQVLVALDDVNDKYKDVKGSMESLKEVRYSDLQSAISGLGAALQEKIVTPISSAALPIITSLAETATDVLNGLGEASDPPKDKVWELVDGVRAANDEISSAIANTEGMVENAGSEAENVEYLGERLLKLNEIEDKTLAQKNEMSAVVQELSDYIPEIATAYDAESGSMNKSNGEIRAMINNTKELMVTQAQQQAMQELITKELEAQQQLNKANEAEAAIIDQIGFLREEKELMESLYDDVDMDPEVFDTKMLEYWKQRLDDCTISQEEYNEIISSGAYTYDMYFDRLQNVNSLTQEYSEAAGDAAEESKKAQDNYNGLIKQEEDLGKASEALLKKMSGTGDAAEDGAASMKQLGEAARDTVPPLNEAGQYTFKLGENYMVTAEAAEKSTAAMTEAANESAQAQKEAAKSILDTYNGYVSEIESDMQNKISLFDKFDTSDGGEDMTVEEMTENLESQNRAFEEYADRLARVKEHVGKEISPEFMRYLQDMGMEGDNVLKHILATFDEEDPEAGAEKVRRLCEAWTKAMDQTEAIAEVGAANRAAFEMATGDLGSSDIEFTQLRYAIDTAVENAAQGWEALPEKTREALENTIDTAQQCGIKIPEGLADGMISGDISPEEAIAQLGGSIQGAFDGLVEMANEAGIEVPPELAAGIEAGGTEAVEAYSKLIALISQKNPELQQALEDAGDTDAVKTSVENSMNSGIDAISEAAPKYQEETKALVEAIGSGFADGGRIQEAVEKVFSEAIETIEKQATKFEQAGNEAGKSGADGITKTLDNYRKAGEEAGSRFAAALSAQRRQAESAGQNLGNAALSAAAAYQGSFYNVGYNMAAGIASGIRDGQSGVIRAVQDTIRQSLNAGKREADIHSPSRKFRTQVGQQIATGMAFGIKDKASLASDQASKMSNKVYTKATNWLDKYKKKQMVSLSDEKWYWQQVLKHTKNGTTAYNNALKKIDTIKLKQLASATGLTTGGASKIKNNFGVSKTTGTGDNKKNKTTEEYYSDVFTAAQKYMANQQAIRNISLQQELTYWQEVQKRLKKGTQGRYDAAKQIKNLKIEIADAKAMAAEEAKQAAIDKRQTHAAIQQDMLDKYKVYYKMSARAEMQYWDIARKQFKSGTDERIEADRKYLEAQQAWYDEWKELDEDYAKNSKKINDDLADSVKELQDAYTDAIASRKKEILSSMDLFESWDASGYTGEQLLHNLQTQVAGLALWEQQLEELKQKNLSSELIEELEQLGPDAAANIYSLNQMTAEQLDEYQKLWEQKNSLAQSQAVKENESLRAETNDEIKRLREEAQAELGSLNADYRAALNELNEGIDANLKSLVSKAGKIAEDTVSGLIAGIKTAADSVDTYRSTTKIVETVSNQLSALEQEGGAIGKSTLDSILEELTNQDKIQGAAKQATQSIKSAMQEELQRQQDALQVQADTLSFAGLASLNRLTETAIQPTQVVNVDNGSLATLISSLISLVGGLSEKMDNQQIVMDTGALVGAIQPAMSRENAAASIRRSRGML